MANSELKNQLIEKIWLEYFNRVLFEKGIISEPERNKIALQIDGRKTSVTITKRGKTDS